MGHSLYHAHVVSSPFIFFFPLELSTRRLVYLGGVRDDLQAQLSEQLARLRRYTRFYELVQGWDKPLID